MADIRIGFLKDNVGDDEKASFGNDVDYSIVYDSGADEFQIIDEDISAPILTADSAQTIALPEGDLSDGSNTIYDASNSHVPAERQEGHEKVQYSPGIVSWEDGLSDEEVFRIGLQSGETFVVERIEFRQKGGGTSSSADIDVRDVGASTTIGSQSLGGTTKDPGSSGAGNTVIVRLTNSTGSSIEASPIVHGYIAGA